jgi:hypothetical protein
MVLRLTVCAGVLSAAFAGLTLCHLGPTDELNPQPDGLPSLLTVIDQECAKSSGLDEARREVLARCENRKEIIDDLLAQRLTLREAAARFGELNEQMPAGAQSAFRTHFAGETDAQRCYQQVISATAYRFLDKPDKAAGVRARLLREFQDRQAASFGDPD